jgi:uncharacterized protein (DUF1501 family)
MDIWHTARRETPGQGTGHRATGWLGRCLDAQSASASGAAASRDVPALHLGPSRLPLALVGDRVRVPSVQTLEGFKLEDGGSERVRRVIREAAAARREDGDDLVTFLQQSTVSALESSRRVQESLAHGKAAVAYPGTGLGKRLQTVAQLIDAGLETRVYYVELDGFDTHANQAAAHAGLLAELSGAVTAFVQDMTARGHGKRVLAMTFSEFGRRVKENASQGTDHGAAAPMFVAGGRVKSGLIGKHPSLADLDEGDLKFATDFRGVYAGVLEHWLGVASEPVLGKGFAPVKVTA